MALNFIGISDINGGIMTDTASYVRRCEEIYHQRLAEAAEKIRVDADERPLVLLSGPSGSGKTTSAMRIADLLRKRGLTVHTISMDNYFLPDGYGEMPLDEDGKVDLESPLRMDIPLFAEHMEKLFKREEVNIPRFNFKTQSRSEGYTLKREKNEIIIIEGIHALNPEVTGDTDSFTTCVYVSVRTRIRDNEDTVMHPRAIRLMRRLCRDKLFRGRSAADVFGMLRAVNRGEDLYIMPHKHRADFDIDTFLAYEPSVYCSSLLDELKSSPDLAEYSDDYGSAIKILSQLTPLTTDDVPGDSLVREFIGGSTMKY
ncbi:MAG: nucleoside kinase [Oscillospiraceae bacterium]|nr:nucleoside kinase [Oscillospiraceae bacterium]